MTFHVVLRHVSDGRYCCRSAVPVAASADRAAALALAAELNDWASSAGLQPPDYRIPLEAQMRAEESPHPDDPHFECGWARVEYAVSEHPLPLLPAEA